MPSIPHSLGFFGKGVLASRLFGLALILGVTLVAVAPEQGYCAEVSGTPTLAMSATPGVVLDGNRLLVVVQELFATGSATDYTVLRLPNPSRLVLEFPNASLNPMHRNRRVDINRAGIQSLLVTEEKGQLYSSVKLTFNTTAYEVAQKLQVSKDKGTIALLNPAVAASSSPSTAAPVAKSEPVATAPSKQTASTGQVVMAYPTIAPVAPAPADTLANRLKQGVNPAVQAAPVAASAPAPQPPSPAPATTVVPGNIVIEDIRLTPSGLLLLGPDVGQRLNLKQRIVLNNPSRLVLDFDNARLARKQLAQIYPGEGPWRNVRVGQFDERTVRIVLETNQPNRYQVIKRGDPALGQFLAVQLSEQIYSTLQTGAPSTSLRDVLLSRDTPNGQAQLKIDSQGPLSFQLHTQGDQILVDLLNVPVSGPGMAFNVTEFGYLNALVQRSLAPQANGSTLVLDLRGTVSQVSHELSNGGRTLVLSFDLPRPTGTTPIKTPAGTVVRPPAVATTPKVPPSGTLLKAPYRARIVVDAGHGGKDFGAMRAGVNEKDLNLSMALTLKAALEARGLTVLMTRTGDTFVPLPDISGFSNRNAPDLFISVHHNASSNPAIYGIETYYYHAPSRPLADRIHRQLVQVPGIVDRKVRTARFYVVNHTAAPAVLLEMGYVSNAQEREACQGSARQQATAEAIANGVVDYLNMKVSAQP